MSDEQEQGFTRFGQFVLYFILVMLSMNVASIHIKLDKILDRIADE